MTELPRPISESYWVEPGRLLAGEYPGKSDEERTRKRLDALLEAGLDTFIDLTRPDELVPYTGILGEEARIYGVSTSYRRFAIGDFGLPTPELMNDLLATMEQALKAGRNVYLHCWGGIGRTGTTVGCYLVRQGKTGDEALDQLAAWWRDVPKSSYHPRSPETEAQAAFVRSWTVHDDRLRELRR